MVFMLKKNISMIFFLLLPLLEVYSFADAKPSIDISTKEKNILAKKNFEILIHINAKKENEPYCFFPPEFENQSENLLLDIKKIGTKESENEVNVEILIEGIAQEPGEYTIGPMKIPYILLSSNIEAEFVKDSTSVIPTSYWDVPSLQIKVKSIAFLKYRNFIFVIVGTSILFMTISLSILLYRNKNKRQMLKAEVSFNESLHVARKHRLDGNYYEYFKTLLEIINKLQGKDKNTELINLEKKLKEKINEVGYKGINPTEQEMDLFWKEVTTHVSVYDTEKRE